MKWDDKPYHSLNYHYKKQFGQKVYKISLNAGMGCPNRDGTISTGGCIFCSEGGSGDFAPGIFITDTDGSRIPDIHSQIASAKVLLSKKNTGNSYIAYFQAYTNTYAPVDYLRRIFLKAISEPDIAGLSIATRPDCLDSDKIALLKELNSIKPVSIELGLQTIHEGTAWLINRGYPLSTFDNCLKLLKDAGLETIVHVILGLPGETKQDMMETCAYLADVHVDGIKLQLLHILKNTALATNYPELKTMDLDEYAALIVSIIERLPEDIVVHRITGDGPKKLLIAPLWSTDKKRVLNTIMKEFATRNTWQGKYYDK